MRYNQAFPKTIERQQSSPQYPRYTISKTAIPPMRKSRQDHIRTMFIYHAIQSPTPASYQLASVGPGANPSSEDAGGWRTWQTARKMVGISNMPPRKAPSVLERQVVIESQATESVFREIARTLGYRLQVQGNPSAVPLSGVLSQGMMTARQALSAIGSLSTVDITVNEPLRLLQVRMLSSATTDTAAGVSVPAVTDSPASVSMPLLAGAQPLTGVQPPAEVANGGLPAALMRNLTLQRGNLQSVLRQVTAITGYQVSVHPSAPMGVIGDGLPWGKPVAVAVILHKLGKQSYLDVQVLTQARHVIVTVKL